MKKERKEVRSSWNYRTLNREFFVALMEGNVNAKSEVPQR